jgi:hypothetical protein
LNPAVARIHLSSMANDGHKYQPVSSSEQEAQDDQVQRHHSIEDPAALDLDRHLESFKKKNRKRTTFIVMGAIGAFLFLYWAIAYVMSSHRSLILCALELSFLGWIFSLDQC